MKIAFDVTSAVKPHPTGTARYAVEILRALLRQLPADARVVLGYRLSRLGRRRFAPRFDDPRVVLRPLQSPFAFLTYGRPDLFHGLGVNVPRGLGSIPKLVTLHGVVDPAAVDADRLPKLDRRLAKIRTMLARASRGVVVSEFERRRTMERLGCDGDRLVVVHHGVDPERFRPDADPEIDRAARGAASPARPYVLCVGALTGLKNVGGLLQAYARSRARAEVDLVLAGPKRRESEAILAGIGTLGIGDRVRLPGPLAPDAVPAWMRGARALVHPSRYESFGLPVLEAMACGTPVACSRAAALPEVAGDAALLFDPLDVDAIAAALDEAVSGDARRAELRRLGLARAAGFTWERAAARTLDAYGALLAPHEGPATA